MADDPLGRIARLEAELTEAHRSHDELLGVLDSIHEGLQIVDREWRYRYLNEAACRHGRCEREQVVGRTMMECFPGIDATPMFTELWRCARERVAGRLENAFHFPDGTTRVFDLRIAPYADGVVIVSIDVTDRVQQEQRARQSQRHEALGRLSGGVAHDFNNLLTVVDSFATFARKGMDPASPAYEDIGQILEASRRAADLTRQLLAFARYQPVEPAVINLKTLVDETDKFLDRLLGANIERVVHAAADLWNVCIDRSALEQVVVNLAVNARDAMVDGGRLTIETVNATLDEEYVLR